MPCRGRRRTGKDSTITTIQGRFPGKVTDMHEKQRVADLAVEVLARQAEARAKRTGEPFEGRSRPF